jgi:hypothetical protein
MRSVNPFTVRARQLMALGGRLHRPGACPIRGRQHECALQWAGGRAE